MIYRCDNKFNLDVILDMMQVEKAYGICLLSGKQIKLYSVSINGSYKNQKLLISKSFELQKNQKKGGQSQARIERLRQEKYNSIVDSVANIVARTYSINNNTEYRVSYLIFAGNAVFKHKVKEHSVIRKYFSDKCPIVKVLDIPEITNSSILKVMEMCQEVFDTEQNKEEKKLQEDLEYLTNMDSDMLLFGKKEIEEALNNCMVKHIIYSKDSLDDEFIEKINKLNTYGCQINKISNSKINIIGGIVGIKWF